MGKDSKVMNINDSKYFFEIDKTKTVYGLILPLHNKFYILDNDYETLKFIQFLIIKHEWFSMINFDHLENVELINNKNCKEYGCNDTAIKLMEYDIIPTSIYSTAHLNRFNFKLQENLFYIRGLIVKTKNIIKKNTDSTLRDQEWEKNLIIMEKFLNIILPKDLEIKKLISGELQILENFKNIFNILLNQLYISLYDIDLKNLDIYEIKNHIENHLNKELKKMYFKDIDNIISKIVN